MSNISNINGGIQSLQWEVVNYPHHEVNRSEARSEENANYSQGDSVHMSNAAPVSGYEPTLLEDDEVDGVMQETMYLITEDPYAALHAHDGLDASRVAALLA